MSLLNLGLSCARKPGSASTKAPAPGRTNLEEESHLAKVRHPGNPTAAQPRAKHVLCEGKSWGGGHLPGPFDRYFQTFEGIATFRGAHAALHSNFEYQSEHGTSRQVFSSKMSWPLPEHSERSYIFEYQKKPYDLDYFDVGLRSLYLQLLFPDAWEVSTSTLPTGREAAAGTLTRDSHRRGNGHGDDKNMMIHAIQRDSQGNVREVWLSILDEVLGRRRFDAAWFDAGAGAYNVQVRERGKLALSARCRELSREEVTKLAVSPKKSPSWQRIAEPVQDDIESLSMEELAPGLFVVKYHASNSQSLVMAHDGKVTILEAPVSPRNMETLLQKIRGKLGEFVVDRLFVTHHHPAHAGGVAAFAQRGVPIVTTAANAVYFSENVESWREHHESPASKPNAPLHFEVVRDKERFGPPGEGVVAINIGEDSAHTTEHLVFYLEKYNLVFNGDLFSKSSEQNDTRPAGKRARGLHKALSASKLTNSETKIVSAWPIEGQKTMVDWRELEAAVSLAR